MAITPTPPETSILAQLLEPLGHCLTPKLAQRIAELRATPEAQARIDELADKCNEGELTPEEVAEYDSYVDAIESPYSKRKLGTCSGHTAQRNGHSATGLRAAPR